MSAGTASRVLRAAGSRGLKLPRRVNVYEVGPRDGLQNERHILDTQTKVAFVNKLSATGVSSVEAASFVSPKWMPSLADGAEVLQQITPAPGVHYPVLVPNMKGLERASKAGALTVALMATPSETFSKRNMSSSVAESTAAAMAVAEAAHLAGIRTRAYISCALGCPFEGFIHPDAVAELTAKLLRAGCYEVALSDTHGQGTPGSMEALLDAVTSHGVPAETLAVHCHDTYGQALANVLVALHYGVATVDASVAGLGGCPLAGGTGNLATEDLVWMLDGLGVESGVDFDQAVAAGHFITRSLMRPNASRAAVARLRDKSKPNLEALSLSLDERAKRDPTFHPTSDPSKPQSAIRRQPAAWVFEEPIIRKTPHA